MKRSMMFLVAVVVANAAGGAAMAGSLTVNGLADSLAPGAGTLVDPAWSALVYDDQSGAPAIESTSPQSQTQLFSSVLGSLSLPTPTSSTYKYSINFFVNSTGWSGQAINTGVSGIGRDEQNSISARPSIAYRQGGSLLAGQEGFYIYDYMQDTWSSKVADANYGLNVLTIMLNVGIGMEYKVNGTSIGSVSDSRTRKLMKTLDRFNQSRAGDSSDGNVTTVPLPSTLWMGMSLLGGLGLAGYLRRRSTTGDLV